MMRSLGLPDRDRALDSYRRLAPRYDAATRRIGRKRLRAIGLLRLSRGDTVLDAACGTGAALDALSRAVGPEGRVIGVELSPPMIAQARGRVRELGLRNATLIQASMEEAVIPGPVDAVLLSYAHDVLRSRAALRAIFAAARPGTRVAAAGAKLYPRALSFLNLWVLWRVRGYMSTQEGLERPWSLLLEYVPDFEVTEVTFLGSGYIGSGTCRGGQGTLP